MKIENCKSIDLQVSNCQIQPTTNNWKHLIVNEVVQLPVGYPSIRSIKSVKVSLKINSTNFMQTPDSEGIINAEGTYLSGLKLFVNGEIDQVITYDSGEICKIYSFTHTQPFSTYIVMPLNYDITRNVCLKSCIEGVLVNQISGEEIQKNVGVFLVAS